MMFAMLMILGLSDTMAVGMWAANLIVTIILAICLNRVAASTRKFERAEDAREKEKKEFQDRFQLGDEEMKELFSGDHALELKFTQQLAIFREDTARNMATKEDLRRHEDTVSKQMQGISGQITELGKHVAVLTDRANEAVRGANQAVRNSRH